MWWRLPSDATPFARLKVAELALKVEARRLALDEEKSRLLDAAANAAIDEIVGAMRDALLNWPARVSGQIAADLGVKPHVVQTVLQQKIADLLTEAADRFDPSGLGDRSAVQLGYSDIGHQLYWPAAITSPIVGQSVPRSPASAACTP